MSEILNYFADALKPAHPEEPSQVFDRFFQSWERRAQTDSRNPAVLDNHPELVAIAKESVLYALSLPSLDLIALSQKLDIKDPISYYRSSNGTPLPFEQRIRMLRVSISIKLSGSEFITKLGYDPHKNTLPSPLKTSDISPVNVNRLFAKIPDYVTVDEFLPSNYSNIQIRFLYMDVTDLASQATTHIQYLAKKDNLLQKFANLLDPSLRSSIIR